MRTAAQQFSSPGCAYFLAPAASLLFACCLPLCLALASLLSPASASSSLPAAWSCLPLSRTCLSLSPLFHLPLTTHLCTPLRLSQFLLLPRCRYRPAATTCLPATCQLPSLYTPPRYLPVRLTVIPTYDAYKILLPPAPYLLRVKIHAATPRRTHIPALHCLPLTAPPYPHLTKLFGGADGTRV